VKKAAVFAVIATILVPAALAVDGTVLINQATVLAAGGFPYRITQSGSYRLSGNLLADPNKQAIEIAANQVRPPSPARPCAAATARPRPPRRASTARRR